MSVALVFSTDSFARLTGLHECNTPSAIDRYACHPTIIVLSCVSANAFATVKVPKLDSPTMVPCRTAKDLISDPIHTKRRKSDVFIKYPEG